MRVSGKAWGTTREIRPDIHLIRVIAGGYCSVHRHRHRHNGFLVLEGQLLVRIWQEECVDVLALGKHDYTEVVPGRWHQFEALTSASAIEMYWTDPASPEDIERRSVGGVKAASGERPHPL